METGETTRSRSTISAMSGILISRIFGFLREMVIAGFFGLSPQVDAFYAAYRIPNFFRTLLGEGSLSAAFIPVLSRVQASCGRETSVHLTRALFSILLVISGALCLVGITFSSTIISAIAPGFSPEVHDLAAHVMRIAFPFFAFLTLGAWSMGILHTRGRFFLPAVAPICLSGSQIFFILVLGVYFEPDPIYALAWGVLIGGALQFLVQVPALVKEGYAIRLEWDPGLSDIRRIGVLFVPVVIALGVNQINSLVDTFLSSFLEQGSLAALNFAARLYTFPLGLFGASVAMVALPSLSRTNADHDLSTSNHLAEVVQWWQRTLFYLLPATVFLIAFPNEVVALIYQRGSFGSQAVQRVGGVLLLYAIGLPAFGSVKILASGYYSLQDTRSPMIRAVIATLTNILLSVLLMHWIGVRGIALATSVAAYLHVGLLAVGLSGKAGNRVMDRKAGMRLAIMLAACAVMLGVGLLTWRCSPAGAVAGGFIQRSLWLLLVAGMMAGTYLLVARLAGIRGR